MEKTQNAPIFNVSDFIAVVNQTFEYAYSTVEIEGEVSSFKVNHNKFVFFDIKDETGILNCFMTVWQLRVPIEDGMKVIVSAVPKLTNWGKFSLTVKAIRPSGEGAIKKSFEILKQKLDKEGLFAVERKRILPKIPRNIAVITSAQSAGYADFIKILNDRWAGLDIEVANVQVQGNEAPDQIINAINYFNQKEILPEILVIIRGGGSTDDLAVFNDELLVRAVALSRIPTITGIGHEIDENLVDLVADVRASTPSNVAQILVPDKIEFVNNIKMSVNSILPIVVNTIDRHSRMINEEMKRLVSTVENLIDKKMQFITMQKNILTNLNPMTILARGYSIVRGSVNVGSDIEIETSSYIIKAEVKNVESK